MANATYFPRQQRLLLQWSENLRAQLSAPGSEARFGVSAERVAAFVAAQGAFAAAMAEVADPQRRTTPAITRKNTLLVAMKEQARWVVAAARAHPGLTDEDREVLQIGVPRPARRRAGRPESAPAVDLSPRVGAAVGLRILRDDAREDQRHRGRLPGAIGAMVWTFVGEEPPTEVAAWRTLGLVTTWKRELRLASDTPAGSCVWVVAAWMNRRGELGPMSSAASLRIGGGRVVVPQTGSGLHLPAEASGGAVLRVAA